MTNDQTVTQAAHDCVAEAIAQEIADHSPHGKKTDNYARIYQAAYLGAAKARKDLAAAHSGEGREDAEHCRKCGRDNPSWSAPSPLWNAVMRGGSIDGNPIHDDLVCPSCFIGLAMDAGIASGWRLIATDVNVLLETVTPSGRVWDDAAFLWGEQHSSHSGEGRSNGAGEAAQLRDALGDLWSIVHGCDLRLSVPMETIAKVRAALAQPEAGGER